MGFPPDLATMKRCDLFRIDVEDIGDVFDLDEVEGKNASARSCINIIIHDSQTSVLVVITD